MTLLRRGLALLLVTVLGSLALAPARAFAAQDAATRAADYIVSTFTTGDTPYGDVGSAADSLIALAAAGDGTHTDQIAGIVAFLQKGAPDYVKQDAGGTTGAAKLALAAAAAKADAKDFGGVDLVAEVKAGIGSDGSFGSYPGPFASGLAMLALARNGEQVPDSMVDYLLTYAEPRSGETGGGFACATYPFKADGDCPAADPDSTAMAVLGLQASGSDKASTAATDALNWLAANQQSDGSWKNYSPVNSTGLVGPLFPAGSEQATKASAYVVSQQLDSGALTTGVDDKANLLATQQGVFALTGTTYATVGTDAAASASPSPTASDTASAAPSPGPSAPAAPTGTDPVVGWTLGALLVLALGAAAAAASRNRVR